MRWSVWLWVLVAALVVAGVGAGCGGSDGAAEREVGSQRPAAEEAGSQHGAEAGGDAEDGLADVLEADDDRGAAQDGSVTVRSGVIAVPANAEAAERAMEESRSSSDSAAGWRGGGEVPEGAIRIDVVPTSRSLTMRGPADIDSFPLPLQLTAGSWNCAVEVDLPAVDEAEGLLVVTFADFDESGSEASAEAAGPEWAGEARLDVAESAEEDDGEATTERRTSRMWGVQGGREFTATIESDLEDGMWTIRCQRIDE